MKKIAFNILFAGMAACTIGVFCACSDETYDPDPARNWAGTTNYFESTDEKGFGTYYNPVLGRCGDPMPFYDQREGNFKVLYLQEYDNNAGSFFHPIWAVATGDGANYAPLNELLPTGTSINEQDAALGTGCGIYSEADGKYYIYYTGHNGNVANREVIMRATSADGRHWTKDPSFLLKGADYGYSANDFRDPQVFKTDDGVWHMVISSNLRFAEFKSSDLKNWEHVGGFNMVWDRMCECPDVFKMGNYWYLIYSEAYKADWSRKVKYMMADSWENLKKCFDDPGANWPKDGKEGVLDSRAFYAGKTASANGTDRYIWGWCPIRTGTTNYERNINVGADSEPAWAGALVCHKIIQHSDGTLTLGEVPAIKGKYNKPQPVSVVASNGYNDGKLSGDNAYVMYSRLGVCNHLSFTVKTANKGDKFGISLVRGTDSKKYYTMVVNPEDGGNNRKVNFEEEGAEGIGFIRGIDGYKFATPADNTYKVDIYTDNSVMVMYINDNVCYTNRIHGITKNCWSINGYGADITVSDVAVSRQ